VTPLQSVALVYRAAVLSAAKADPKANTLTIIIKNIIIFFILVLLFFNALLLNELPYC